MKTHPAQLLQLVEVLADFLPEICMPLFELCKCKLKKPNFKNTIHRENIYIHYFSKLVKNIFIKIIYMYTKQNYKYITVTA